MSRQPSSGTYLAGDYLLARALDDGGLPTPASPTIAVFWCGRESKPCISRSISFFLPSGSPCRLAPRADCVRLELETDRGTLRWTGPPHPGAPGTGLRSPLQPESRSMTCWRTRLRSAPSSQLPWGPRLLRPRGSGHQDVLVGRLVWPHSATRTAASFEHLLALGVTGCAALGSC